MKSFTCITAALSLFAFSPLALADADHENHEIIEKVMKEGLKGKESPLAKVLEGASAKKETKELAELVHTLEGTKAPRGEQEAYEKKVAELIAAMDAIASGKTEPAAIERLDNASDCKACHGDHKPKKE